MCHICIYLFMIDTVMYINVYAQWFDLLSSLVEEWGFFAYFLFNGVLPVQICMLPFIFLYDLIIFSGFLSYNPALYILNSFQVLQI